MIDVWQQFQEIDNGTYRCKSCVHLVKNSDTKLAWEHIQNSHRHIYVKMKREENGNTIKNENSESGNADDRREQVNAQLIELVRGNPCLYDKRHEHYKDVTRKARIWDELAKQLEMENGKQATLRWKNLGDTYARNRKRQALGSIVTWPHYASMAWLEQYRERVEPARPFTPEIQTNNNNNYEEALEKFFVVMENNTVMQDAIPAPKSNGIYDELSSAAAFTAAAMRAARLKSFEIDAADNNGILDNYCNNENDEENCFNGRYNGCAGGEDSPMTMVTAMDNVDIKLENGNVSQASSSNSCLFNGISTTIDEPRLKRARKTIDGIFYNRLNGATNGVESNGNGYKNDTPLFAGTKRCTNGSENDEKSSSMMQNESQLFGALIARKLDDLDRSTRLKAQTEILALINAKLMDSNALLSSN